MSIQTERETSRKERKKRNLREEEEIDEDEELEEGAYDGEDPDEDEDFEDEETEKKKHGRKRKKGFPVVALILMFVLIGVTLAAGYFGIQYMEQNRELHASYDEAVAEAAAELDAAKQEYFLADPDSSANTEIREELKSVLLADAREKAEKLESEEAELDATLREAEERISEQEKVEDFEYYKAIYDEYVEGREYVEELLSGN